VSRFERIPGAVFLPVLALRTEIGTDDGTEKPGEWPAQRDPSVDLPVVVLEALGLKPERYFQRLRLHESAVERACAERLFWKEARSEPHEPGETIDIFPVRGPASRPAREMIDAAGELRVVNRARERAAGIFGGAPFYGGVERHIEEDRIKREFLR